MSTCIVLGFIEHYPVNKYASRKKIFIVVFDVFIVSYMFHFEFRLTFLFRYCYVLLFGCVNLN